jgi:hypothetical protein
MKMLLSWSEPTDTFIDLMCCEGSQTSRLDFRSKIYVDIQERPIVNIGKNDLFIKSDVFDFLSAINFGRWGADVMVCLDGIEHLTKENGFRLMKEMEDLSVTQIFFTPLGEYLLEDDANPDHHHSGWLPEDFHKKGYSTIVFPNFHEKLNIGAFFAWKDKRFSGKEHKHEIEDIFEKIKTEIWKFN